jgi:hypothetical protein
VEKINPKSNAHIAVNSLVGFMAWNTSCLILGSIRRFLFLDSCIQEYPLLEEAETAPTPASKACSISFSRLICKAPSAASARSRAITVLLLLLRTIFVSSFFFGGVEVGRMSSSVLTRAKTQLEKNSLKQTDHVHGLCLKLSFFTFSTVQPTGQAHPKKSS